MYIRLGGGMWQVIALHAEPKLLQKSFAWEVKPPQALHFQMYVLYIFGLPHKIDSVSATNMWFQALLSGLMKR